MSARRRSSTTGAAGQAFALVKDARGSVTISFDPNCRPNLVSDKDRYVERMATFAQAAHIVRMSDVDFDYIYGAVDHARRAGALIAAGASLVIITRGARGALAWHKTAGAVRSRRRRAGSSTRSAPATAFKPPFCSPCMRWAASKPGPWHGSAQTSFVACCLSRRSARPSPAGAPAPTRRVARISVPSCPNFWQAAVSDS